MESKFSLSTLVTDIGIAGYCCRNYGIRIDDNELRNRTSDASNTCKAIAFVTCFSAISTSVGHSSITRYCLSIFKIVVAVKQTSRWIVSSSSRCINIA